MKTLLTILLIGIAGAVQANYAEVLATYVDENGMVNYAGLSENRQPLDDYIESLQHPGAEGWTQKDWIAFWINAYNARTLQVIVDHYPIENKRWFQPDNSIKQISGAWDELTAKINGAARTLDEIEHEILRKQYSEPRIHMALVCAAKSCPKLRNEPYVGEKLNDQLADQSRDFLSRPDRFKVDGKTAYLSPIFKWFADDFDSVSEFIKTYSDKDISDRRIKYQSYDWSLNEQQRSTS